MHVGYDGNDDDFAWPYSPGFLIFSVSFFLFPYLTCMVTRLRKENVLMSSYTALRCNVIVVSVTGIV